jgi:hypothetical protein
MAKKEGALLRQPGRIDTGGGAYVGGDVKAAGDFIGRDQHVEIRQTSEGVSLEGFLQLLAELRQRVPAAGLDGDTAEIIEGDVRVVEEQVQKEEPRKAIIVAKLKGVTEVLTETGKVAAAAAALVPLAEKALTWAQQLLG